MLWEREVTPLQANSLPPPEWAVACTPLIGQATSKLLMHMSAVRLQFNSATLLAETLFYVILHLFFNRNLGLEVLITLRCVTLVKLEMELVSEMLVCRNHVMWLSTWECFIESYFHTQFLLTLFILSFMELFNIPRDSLCVVMKLNFFFYQPNKYRMLINCPSLCNEWMIKESKNYVYKCSCPFAKLEDHTVQIYGGWRGRTKHS